MKKSAAAAAGISLWDRGDKFRAPREMYIRKLRGSFVWRVRRIVESAVLLLGVYQDCAGRNCEICVCVCVSAM